MDVSELTSRIEQLLQDNIQLSEDRKKLFFKILRDGGVLAALGIAVGLITGQLGVCVIAAGILFAISDADECIGIKKCFDGINRNNMNIETFTNRRQELLNSENYQTHQKVKPKSKSQYKYNGKSKDTTVENIQVNYAEEENRPKKK